ncbi:MAG: hypothetical protein LAT68_07220 [Cyclobacteriaceae bacterium]|nr:hypothetical protein [Cyclobacteriaceae bacterium]MCH8516105.1 hypothetical protein [Cyclobacteriaceae bacterium]
MNSKPEFKESQRFTQLWVIMILFSINFIFLLGIYRQIIQNEPFGSNPMNDESLLIFGALVFIFTLLFFKIALETKINHNGIHYRFFPIHIKYRSISWSEIDKCYTRAYSPVKEYGGWGIRLGRQGKAYNIKGMEGLQLHLKDDKKLLLGTQKSDLIDQYLSSLSKAKGIYQASSIAKG